MRTRRTELDRQRLVRNVVLLLTLLAGVGSPATSSAQEDTAAARKARERLRRAAQRVDPQPPQPPQPPKPAGRISGPPREPRPGTAERAALTNAVRLAVGNSSSYRIDHLRATPRWAFFSGTEVVPLDASELQETDLSVQALLERQLPADGAPRWEVVELWTLPTNDRAPRTQFLQRLRDRMTRDAVPKALFPPDLFK